MGIDNDHALACVAVLPRDRYRIALAADFLAGKVRHKDRLAGHRRLLESVLGPLADPKLPRIRVTNRHGARTMPPLAALSPPSRACSRRHSRAPCRRRSRSAVAGVRKAR